MVTMLFKAKTIEQITAENPGLDASTQWQKHHDENWSELKRIDQEAKKNGTILHRFVQESVADGYALYQIVKINKKTVRIELCEGFSDYTVPYWGKEATISREYAEKSVKGRDALAELFGKKKED